MNGIPTLLRTPTLALCLLALACDSGAKKDDATKKDDAAEAGDAEKKPEKKVEEAPKEPPKPRFDVPAPPAEMSPEEIVAFAKKYGDPTGGTFTLEQAFEGAPELADESKGKLTATFTTSMGAFDCELFEKQAPITVANFVGLARGTRPSYDKDSQTWKNDKLFDGVIFHRVIKGFMIQTGDASTKGGSSNPGFVIVDELDGKHTKAGTLSMANREKPNSGSTQFFITVKPTPHLDGKHSVFGQCEPEVAQKISEVKVDARRNDRPYEQIKIESVVISRK